MNSKLVMTLSAGVLGITGLLLSFLPEEIALLLGWTTLNSIMLQLLGALYLGFAMLNWTAKSNLIGGIYGRPITIGNFMHFLVGALALLKYVFGRTTEDPILIAEIVYVLFALAFGYLFYTNPPLKNEQ